MSTFTTLTNARTGNAIDVQLDNISTVVIAGAGGAIPWNSFECYTRGQVYDDVGDLIIKQGDLLTDTATGVEYRASGTPEPFDDLHLEIMISKNTSLTP